MMRTEIVEHDPGKDGLGPSVRMGIDLQDGEIGEVLAPEGGGGIDHTGISLLDLGAELSGFFRPAGIMLQKDEAERPVPLDGEAAELGEDLLEHGRGSDLGEEIALSVVPE